MAFHDDDLREFAANGAPALPAGKIAGYVDHKGARIWYASHGSGVPLILLHGGLGHSGNWGYQVPVLIDRGHRVILIDSRGHGRSTRDSQPYSYELMASDVLAVMDALHVESAVLVGWSDGACIALTLAMQAPERTAAVFFFGCNVDPTGLKEIVPRAILNRCLARHAQDYASLSATPANFRAFAAAVDEMMKTQPDYSARQLAQISMPFTIVYGEHDEFIRREHLEQLAHAISGAEFVLLPDVSHFAPLQRPERFNAALQSFLNRLQQVRHE
jgi:pimeloyl-ACP methyl ester carboxylesterase